MKLNLYWNDIDGSAYRLALLEKINEDYILTIDETELKKAIKKGCIGIGSITFLQETYISKELFPFFKNRIPWPNHPRIKYILNELKLEKYDDMEILKRTKAIIETDRYYVEETT